MQEWELEWVEEAERLARTEYARSYNRADSPVAGEVPEDAQDDVVVDGEFDFGDISLGKRMADRDELDEYLAQPVEHVADALMWWRNKRHVFPKLSKMAADYLSIPGKCQ